MKIQRQRSTVIELPGASVECLRSFLRRPRKSLSALLSRQRLEVVGPNSFAYASRPFGLAKWQIQPRLSLTAFEHDSRLLIQCRECTIDGLGDWQQAIRFGFDAQLSAASEACHAKVSAELLIHSGGLMAWAPAGLLQTLAEQALDQALARMERRCHAGLRQQMFNCCCVVEASPSLSIEERLA